MQREQVLSNALNLLEQQGLANTTLEMLAKALSVEVSDLTRFWPDREALLYDCLRYHSQQIDTWRRQLQLDETLSPQQKLLARYQTLSEQVQNQRYPAACLLLPAVSILILSTLFTNWLNSRNRPRCTIQKPCCKRWMLTMPIWSHSRWS